jgi:hypothetical protein
MSRDPRLGEPALFPRGHQTCLRLVFHSRGFDMAVFVFVARFVARLGEPSRGSRGRHASAPHARRVPSAAHRATHDMARPSGTALTAETGEGRRQRESRTQYARLAHLRRAVSGMLPPPSGTQARLGGDERASRSAEGGRACCCPDRSCTGGGACRVQWHRMASIHAGRRSARYQFCDDTVYNLPTLHHFCEDLRELMR